MSKIKKGHVLLVTAPGFPEANKPKTKANNAHGFEVGDLVLVENVHTNLGNSFSYYAISKYSGWFLNDYNTENLGPL